MNGNAAESRDVRQDFASMPDDLKTQELCDAMFAGDMRNFAFIPDRFKTPAMCRLAVAFDASNFAKVPKGLQTMDMYRHASAVLGGAAFSAAAPHIVLQEIGGDMAAALKKAGSAACTYLKDLGRNAADKLSSGR